MADVHTPLPCPFCGKEPVLVKLVEDDGFDRWHQVHCEECGIEMGEEYRSDAIEAWNRRSPSQDAETIKALTDLLAKAAYRVIADEFNRTLAQKVMDAGWDWPSDAPQFMNPLTAELVAALAGSAS